MSNLGRRDASHASAAAAAAGWALQGRSGRRILIDAAADATFGRRLAERELLRGLRRLGVLNEIRLIEAPPERTDDDLLIALRVEPSGFRDLEAYSIASPARDRLALTGASDAALAFAVFDFLERQGAYFGIDGDSYPLERPRQIVLPPASEPWTASPRFAVRGLLPWPDFLNCISVYNDEDFRAYFESMLRMRFNTFGMHVYTSASQWAESYLSFEFAGVGHLSFLDNSASHRWGYLPQRTSRYAMGASQFYDGEVFGSDATRHARDPWEQAERAQRLLRDALAYARRLGMRTGVGFEPYQVPDEIWKALPPEVRPEKMEGISSALPRFDVESVTARKLLEARLGQLLEAYPDVDHVWLWQDEQMNWEGRKKGMPFSVTPFRQAHDFLRRHAPEKRMVLAGWGGVVRDFEHFHRNLPLDVVFSCLSDTLGWDPVHEVFGALEGRERWPIPWLEDDPAMWLPQFHVHRFERDLNLAEQYGCQGMIGIHWRHRIVDPTAGYQARFSWDRRLTPAEHYASYARTQAAGPRAARLAEVLTDLDKERRLLATVTGEVSDGRLVWHGYASDYNEAFMFGSRYEPEPAVVESQKQVAAALRALADDAGSAAERERLEYLARHVEFLVPYTEAWTLAHRLQEVLDRAAELKKAGRVEDARALVRSEAVPMWLRLAPEVRAAMLHFQSVVATRNDLGTLASMHNKFVRLALVRLRLSIQEYLGELPPETESLLAEVTAPDAAAPARLFVPTRPSVLGKDETTRLLAIATGDAPVESVLLHTRPLGSRDWTATPATLLGRRTYEATLGPFDARSLLVEYFVSAQVGVTKLVSPPEGDANPYAITMV